MIRALATLATLRRLLVRALRPPATDAERIADWFDVPRDLIGTPGTYENAAAEQDRLIAAMEDACRYGFIADDGEDTDEAIALWRLAVERDGLEPLADPEVRQNAALRPGYTVLTVEGWVR